MNRIINCCDYLEKMLVLDRRVLYTEISIVVISSMSIHSLEVTTQPWDKQGFIGAYTGMEGNLTDF